jgi:hypothetical protein
MTKPLSKPAIVAAATHDVDLERAPPADLTAPDPGDVEHQFVTHPLRIKQWREQVAADANLPPIAYRFALVISGFVSRETGYAWPGMDLLRKLLGGVSRQAIQKAVKSLRVGGHLTVKVHRGRPGEDGKTNHYHLRIKPDDGP